MLALKNLCILAWNIYEKHARYAIEELICSCFYMLLCGCLLVSQMLVNIFINMLISSTHNYSMQHHGYED